MNKNEFIDEMATKTGLTKKDCATALNSTLEIITEQLSKGEQIGFIGFGTFSVAKRAARTAKVPGTDKTVEVAETTVAKFKVGKALKEAVAK